MTTPRISWSARKPGAPVERLRTGWDRANSPIVTADDIAEVVSMWTGVPVMQIAQEESQRLLQMEDELRKPSSVRKKPSRPSPKPSAGRAPG
jgi:hypothetical protein